MIDIVAKVRTAAARGTEVFLSDGSGWPCKGGNISVVTTTAGQMKKIEGTVVELEPRTAVSPGRLVVQDNTTGAQVELPAPTILED